jgi:hypothetical protein
LDAIHAVTAASTSVPPAVAQPAIIRAVSEIEADITSAIVSQNWLVSLTSGCVASPDGVPKEPLATYDPRFGATLLVGWRPWHSGPDFAPTGIYPLLHPLALHS